MKNIFLLILISVLTLGVSAQTGNLVEVSTDTITDTGTIYQAVPLSFSSQNLLSIQVKVTQLTGTTAGTAILEHSILGVDYVTHPTADTLTLTNGVKYVWTIENTPLKKYRIKFTGTGTQTSFTEGQYVYK